MLVFVACNCVQSACRRDQALAGLCFCNGAATKLRLIEQACGCSTVRGGGGGKVHVLVSAAGIRPCTCCVIFAFATEPSSSSD